MSVNNEQQFSNYRHHQSSSGFKQQNSNFAYGSAKYGGDGQDSDDIGYVNTYGNISPRSYNGRSGRMSDGNLQLSPNRIVSVDGIMNNGQFYKNPNSSEQ